MKHAWTIGCNDVRVFLKSPASYIWLFGVPLLFVYFMGFAVRGPGDPSNPRPAVLVENLDTNFLGQVLLEELDVQGLRPVDAAHRAEAERGVRIPADFTARVLRAEQANIQFVKVEGSGAAEAALIQLRLVRALIALNSYLVQGALRGGGQPAVTEAALRAAQKAPKPVRLEARFAGRKPVPSGFNFSLPGNLVMYLLMNLTVFGGASLAVERRNGILRRLAVQPVGRQALVMGKICGLVLLGAVQIAFFVTVGRLVFGVNLGANLPAVVGALLLFAWVAASLGVLVASVITSQDKIIGLCILMTLVMAALGGCWWPLEFASPAMRVVAHGVPTAWAMDALHRVISFGGSLADARHELAALCLFGAGANALAARFFRV